MAQRLLLDTRVFLWWKANAPRLGAAAREAIAQADLVLVSAASAWEAAIKAQLGKLELTERFTQGLRTAVSTSCPSASSTPRRSRGCRPTTATPSTAC